MREPSGTAEGIGRAHCRASSLSPSATSFRPIQSTDRSQDGLALGDRSPRMGAGANDDASGTETYKPPRHMSPLPSDTGTAGVPN